MENYKKELIEKMRKDRPTYADMIDFACDNCILNNYIVDELESVGIYFDIYCGSLASYYSADGDEISEEEYCETDCGYSEIDEIYQYYIISERDAQRLADYTNETVIYNDSVNLYLLCVKHFGTSWQGVPANWKRADELDETDE